MSAPLSLRDKQYQYLLGLYGPGLSYPDMLSKYRGGGKSLSDLNYAAYLGDPKKSLADNMDTAIPGSGSLSDQMYADSSGGITTTITNLCQYPRPTGTAGWIATAPANWVHSYAGAEISVDRQATAGVDVAASLNSTGLSLSPANPVLKVGVNYQRSVEIWVDAPATLTLLTTGAYAGGQALLANQWNRVVQQFTGTGLAQFVTGLQVTMTGVSTGIHVKLRKGFLAENPTGRELAFADANYTPGWTWNGTANASTSTGPAVYQSDLFTNLATNPKPANGAGWTGNDGSKWTLSYASNEISVNRLAPAEADIAASLASCGGLLVQNPVLSASKTYQRSVEVWVDAAGTVASPVTGCFPAGQVLVPNQWNKVTDFFTGAGVARYVMAISVNIPGVGTGIHVKFRKAMLCENATGKELAYADGSTAGWIWDGTLNGSTSYGPAIYESAPIDVLMATAPFYVAHRGSGDVWPEHTATAYNNSLGAGIKAIEVSAQRSSDGWWFCLHDAGATGLDRTTNGTGDPKTFTQAQLNTYNVDIANCGPYWPLQSLKMPDLQTVLTTMLADTKVVVFLETKDYSGSAMDDMLAKIQLWFPTKYKTQIIWKSHVTNAAGFTKAKAAGMKCWAYLDYPLDTQQVTDALSRADYIGLPRYDSGVGLTDTEIDTAMGLIGTSVKAICWEPKRRSEVAKLLAKGVDGFVCPPAPYTMTTGPNRTQDQFSTGKWAAGDIPFDTTRNFVIDSATSSAWFNGTASNPSVVMGSLSPSSQYFEIEYEFKYDVLPAATLSSGIAFSKPDDQKYQFQLAGNPTGGYHVVLRQNGQLQLYSHAAGSGSGTQLGATIATTALDTVNWAKVRVRVDATGISVQRMDGTPSSIITSTDSTYRGSYFHLSRNHASTTEFVRFRNVKVTAL